MTTKKKEASLDVNKTEGTTEMSTSDAKALLQTLDSLKKEIEELKKHKREFSDAEKMAVEAAQAEMATDEYDAGPCYLDPNLKMEGYHYRATDLTKRGILEKRLKQGYEIARYSDTTSLDASNSIEKSSLTDAITIHLGNDLVERPGVWMRIPKEKYDARQKAKAEANRRNTQDIIDSGSAGAEFGHIEIGNTIHFKR